LIELLVVIVVIAILAGILVPALMRAKSAARKVECLARLKQWSLATHLFLEENEGFLPREGILPTGDVFLNNWAQVKHADARDVWYNAVAPYMNVPKAADYFLPQDRPAFYEKPSMFHCPSARFPRGTFTSQMAYFSLALNSQLIEPPTNAPTIAFSRIQDVARTALFLDNLLEGEPPACQWQAADNLGQPAATANRFAGRRHGGGGNIAFADGHADWLPAAKVVQMRGPTRGYAIYPPIDVVWELDEFSTH
jgi:prepilin-type processing-associated H-X9-DG protein